MTAAADFQNTIFEMLADPATHSGEKVTRIDTHAAAVFLAGGHAYKIKRAVKFPFLDFSTLARRKAALEAEIEANKPFAPELYLGLVPITREGSKLMLGDKGEPVEWALKMRRFDESQTFDRLATAGRIDADLAAALARSVAKAHGRAPLADAAAWIAALGDYIGQNDTAFRDAPKLFRADEVSALTDASNAALARVRPLLEARGALGLIRRGHGDLHLGNIALIDGKPVPFDALEFDPVMASGDLLYDLAFLLMDLVERELAAAANIVLNVYFMAANRDDDLDALAALPLFMSLRAAIRAKVTAAKLENADASKRETIVTEAKTYFALACRLITPPSPRLIAVGGLSGTGKSLLARGLAPHIPPSPGALNLRSDIERKTMFGIAETEKLPPEAYTADVTGKVYGVLADKARRTVAAGHSAIVDAVFARPNERAAIEDVARAENFMFHGLFLAADLATRMTRVGSRVNDASDADAKVAQAQESYDIGELGWREVDASGTPEQTLANARVALMKNR
jgi:aminoglycoside phosphotransferase family enzyme/predicted kinase